MESKRGRESERGREKVIIEDKKWGSIIIKMPKGYIYVYIEWSTSNKYKKKKNLQL